MTRTKGKWAWMTAAVLLPGVFRLLGEGLGGSIQAGPAGPILAIGLCVGIAAAAIFMAERAIA